MRTKTDLRKHYAQIRANLTASEQSEAATLACKNFLQEIAVKKTDTISAYYPTNNEISPLPLLAKLAEICIETALPAIIDKQSPLAFYRWENGDKLQEHPTFKIQEPAATIAVIPTIIIVPLLAFDKNGNRLGYGGGFYDRTIAVLKASGHKITTVGLSYSAQQAEQLQAEPHDQPLDYVVTDTNVFCFNIGL